ncbi:MAG: invasion associated locus B family protein [Alphaproteobacteria bacterium]
MMYRSIRKTSARVFSLLVAGVLVTAALHAPSSAQTTAPAVQKLPRPSAPIRNTLRFDQGVLKAQFGDWKILCETATGEGAQRCALVQNIESSDRPGFGLVVMVLKAPDGKSRMRVAAPMGIFLPPGLGLRVDGKVIGNAPFWYCRPYACETEAVITPKLLTAFQTGKQAMFVIFEQPDKGTGLPVSLNGFAAGHQALGTWRAKPRGSTQ